MLRCCLIHSAVCLALGAATAGLSFKPSPVPGGVALVPIQGRGPAPKATYHGEEVLIRKAGQGWVAVVGLPLSAKAGPDQIEVEGRPVPFTIKPKRYREQRLRLENPRQVTPNAEDEARIAKEQVLLAPAWKAWPEGLSPSLAFRQPTLGALTS